MPEPLFVVRSAVAIFSCSFEKAVQSLRVLGVRSCRKDHQFMMPMCRWFAENERQDGAMGSRLAPHLCPRR